MAKSGLTLLSATASRIEAVLFVASTQVSERELSETLAVPTREISAALLELQEHLAKHAHGIELQNIAGAWQLVTNPHYAEIISLFRDVSERQRVRISKASVETLAIIAYNQPVTRSEVEEIRSVRSESVIETLLSHGLIKMAGRKKSVGSPWLYRTTDRFLEVFGLASMSELPSLEEISIAGVSQEEQNKEDEADSQA
ncbi:MAG: SMC-Scp complex subunit ScpB [Synergistaceae bacterium]|nr:SMC-Scp complex subunit ScpB [Synergistaceae bacterium]